MFSRLGPVLLLLSLATPALAAGPSRIAFIGLHGGVFEQLERSEKALGVELDYISDAQLAASALDLSVYQVVVLQHLRSKDRERYRAVFPAARKAGTRIVTSTPHSADGLLPELVRQGVIEHDETLSAYYRAVADGDNARRLVSYLLIHYLGRAGAPEPPVKAAQGRLFHPDHEGAFESVSAFLRWSKARGRTVKGAPRVAVVAHQLHLQLQQPKVVAALIEALEAQGALAIAITDFSSDGGGGVAGYERALESFEPQAVIHTCHSRDAVKLRERLGVPHLHSIFFRKQSIDEWRKSILGLSSRDIAFHIVSQEVLGAIEPQIGAGTLNGGGGPESFTPIPDRIEHLAARALSWTHLALTPKAEKKVAFIYWDREMGKAELMRGSATGMFMNAPRSLVNVLARMKEAGYGVDPVPADEDELIEWMQARGRQIGVWAPGVLDRLARSGDAALVPLETYRRWYEAKVPEVQRKALEKRWGPPPGKFLVWARDDGAQFIVIPRVDLGNVVLLPQPLRGEAHDTSLVHDKLVPPPHNYLATYFWLQETFGADAMVHFGTHGTEFLLPGKGIGLSGADWSDLLMGTMPNINPWVINNLGESSPVRRRAYAVLIDHLVPPSVSAGLSDELLNLHNDIDKWGTLADGALKKKFRASITDQVRAEHLDEDLHLDLGSELGPEPGRILTPKEIEQLSSYLHKIHNETTPTSLHVFGEPPREDLVIPWIVTCLRKRFVEALGEVVPVPAGDARFEGDRLKFLRPKAEEAVRLFLKAGLSPAEAVVAVGGRLKRAKGALPKTLQEGFELARLLADGFARTPEEIDHLLDALDGAFIPPGPGNGPDRNPAVVPTGRNMYVMNPEEVPSRPSWELGVALIDKLLADRLKTKGKYPEKIGFTLNAFATFQDYGVMESQILYLMGVRPVWDARNLVADLELIPAAELGRPRIDVFISALGYYRDTLPTRMRLLDRAVRLVGGLAEEGNGVWRNGQRVKRELEAQGVPPERAEALARARIFGAPPGQTGSAGYYYLVEKSGEWDSREELMETYLGFARHVYTDGMWGVSAPEAYDRTIQGTEIVLRTWADRTRSPLSNKYIWYKGGSLARAVQHLTGKAPDFLLSDVRDPDEAAIVNSHDVLRTDFRVRLFNRKWIEGMMKEGYAGADQVAVHVSNAMGWAIMRDGSVPDDIWEEIVDVYVRDSKHLNIREWFEAENPFAFQEVTEILLETARKGYWKPDEATLLEIATEYARSVARHGEGGGLRGGGNAKLEAFVEKTLRAPGKRALDTLLAEFQRRAREQAEPSSADAPKPTQPVEGKRLAPVEEAKPEAELTALPWLAIGILGACLLLIVIGYRLRRGAPGPGDG